MAAELYDCGDNIPFSVFMAKNNGTGLSGLDIRVHLYNPATSSFVLESTALPELSGFPGMYFFQWDSSQFTSKTILIGLIFDTNEGENKIVEEFNVILDDRRQILIDKIDENDGQAT